MAKPEKSDKTAADDKVYVFITKSAGRMAEAAPFFRTLDDLKDYIYAYAKTDYRHTHNADFAVEYDVDEKDPESRWRGAAKWALETGDGEFGFLTKTYAYVDPKTGHACEKQVEGQYIDEEYVASLGEQPTP